MKTFWISAKFEVKANDVFDAMDKLGEIVEDPQDMRSVTVNETFGFLNDPPLMEDPATKVARSASVAED